MASTSSSIMDDAQNLAMRRAVPDCESSAFSSAVTSGHISPADSSASSTSLSSMSEADGDSAKKSETRSEFGKLVDAYGNPFEVPDYTIKQLLDAIPKHCFQRSALRGLSYVLRDVVLLSVTFLVFRNLVTPELVPSTIARFVLWNVYAFLQGLFGTGLWVLAHECGHQAFSSSRVLNDTVGLILHSSLLVPYFSWKISHSKHHKATGHMERDMVFIPRTREQAAKRAGCTIHDLAELTEEAPIVSLLYLLGQQLIGWPNYLLTNITGHNNHERQREGRGKGKHNGFGGGVNHFDPNSPLFEARDAKWIVVSDIGLLVVGTIIYKLATVYGWNNMLVWYFAPYIWVNHWLVAITFLQHTDPSLPHYNSEQWTFVRGAAATIDREFGFIGRQLFHGIIETHVLHHYSSTIPFYNADEATEAIKPIMGKHYRSDVRDGPLGFIKSMWKSARYCQWVEPTEGATGPATGVLFFRNRNNNGPKPAKAQPVH